MKSAEVLRSKDLNLLLKRPARLKGEVARREEVGKEKHIEVELGGEKSERGWRLGGGRVWMCVPYVPDKKHGQSH